MKNIYQNTAKKLLFLKKSLKTLLANWVKELKKDFAYHNKNTELLAIWTILFMTITGLFVVGLKSKLSMILFLLVLSLIITLASVIFTIYYLYAIKYHKKKQLLPRIHNILNKSFKLRTLLRFIKIPYNLKNLKHLIKLNLKFAS